MDMQGDGERGGGEETAVCRPGRQALGGTSWVDSFISDSQPPERSGNKFLPLMSLSL